MADNPIQPDGDLSGVGDPTPEAGTEAPPGPTERPESQPGQGGEVWCQACKAMVMPVEGDCPRGHFLQRNQKSRRNPVNVKRLDRSRQEFTALYQPADAYARTLVERLARVTERLEILSADSPAYARMCAIAEVTVTRLEASQRERAPKDLSAVSTKELCIRLERIARDTRQQLFDAEQAAIRAAAPVPEPSNVKLFVDEPPEPPIDLEAEQKAEEKRQRHEEMKVNDLDRWRALHADDPEEEERVRQERTNEMMEGIQRSFRERR